MNRFFLYLDGDTWLHRLDPRTKVLGLLALFIVAVTFSDPRYLAAPLLLVLSLIVAAGAAVNVRKVWLLLTLLFFYCLLLWPLFVEGRTPFMSVAGMPITREAAWFGFGMGLRLNLMLLGGILLLSTTTVEEFTLALHRYGLPASVSFALSLAFRWVPTLIASAGSIVQAQRARGLDLGAGSLFGKIRRYPPLLVPLVGHHLRHTRLLAMALESKGFSPGAPRREFLTLRMRLLDWTVIFLTLATIGVTAWLRINGYGAIDVTL